MLTLNSRPYQLAVLELNEVRVFPVSTMFLSSDDARKHLDKMTVGFTKQYRKAKQKHPVLIMLRRIPTQGE